ncbi:hypothetical protein PICMEDRAFT_184955, partial [Pichia membranifaciens NRRL Y-2026]
MPMHQEELTDIYIHLKDILKTLSQTPVDREFYADGLINDMIKIKEILEE